MTKTDVIVVGGGVMGSSTALSLARAGRDVIVFEQFQPGHDRGSSHGDSRIFRFSYSESHYVKMAMEALPLWRQLELEAGETFLVTTGGLDTGEGAGLNAKALAEAGAKFELLDNAEAARRFPAITFRSGEEVLFQPDAGIVRADRTISAMQRLAVETSAEFRFSTLVEALAINGDRVKVTTSQESFEAKSVVVTAGGWAPGLLNQTSIDLPVFPTRQTVAYFDFESGGLPTFVDWATSLYALPSPSLGVKAGLHRGGLETNPDDIVGARQETVSEIARLMNKRFPGIGEPQTAQTCIYTNTSDERFIIEQHGPVIVGSACSGHGFKFAPLIGKQLAGLATG